MTPAYDAACSTVQLDNKNTAVLFALNFTNLPCHNLS